MLIISNIDYKQDCTTFRQQSSIRIYTRGMNYDKHKIHTDRKEPVDRFCGRIAGKKPLYIFRISSEKSRV